MLRWKSAGVGTYIAHDPSYHYKIVKQRRGVWLLYVDSHPKCYVRDKVDARTVIAKKLFLHAGYCPALDGKSCDCGLSENVPVQDTPQKKIRKKPEKRWRFSLSN